jgi:AcrR family transcriptional regulator
LEIFAPVTATTLSRSQSTRPLRADAQRNYESLLAAAAATFAANGADASLDDIARRAGVGIGTLYRHFPTRQALLAVLLRDSLQELIEDARVKLDSPSPSEALAAWLRDVVDHAATYRGLAAELLSSSEFSQTSGQCHAMQVAGAQLLARAQEAGEVRSDVTAADLFKLVNGIAWVTEQSPGDRNQVDRLVRVMVDGLRSTVALGR